MDKIGKVAALFKFVRYTSFVLYMSRAKAEHVSNMHLHHTPYSDDLANEARLAVISVTRCIGTCRQSFPIDVAKVAGSELDETPLHPLGPVSPLECIVFSSMSLMREIEISNLEVKDVRFDFEDCVVIVALPASKNDLRGEGTERSFGCTCITGANMQCAYHAALFAAGATRSDGHR